LRHTRDHSLSPHPSFVNYLAAHPKSGDLMEGAGP